EEDPGEEDPGEDDPADSEDLNLDTSVLILNGARVQGLAGEVAEALTDEGWRQTEADNYAQAAPAATTRYYPSEECAAEAEAVGEQLGITNLVESPSAAANGIVNVLRADFSMPTGPEPPPALAAEPRARRRMATEHVAAVVIGSGPNGLAAAVTLARAGVQVVVYEAEDTLGGGARTLDLGLTDAGVQHDLCSAVHPLALASPFFEEFDVRARGVEIVAPDISYAQPLTGRP